MTTFSSLRATVGRRRLIIFGQGLLVGSLLLPLCATAAWVVAIFVAEDPRGAFVRR